MSDEYQYIVNPGDMSDFARSAIHNITMDIVKTMETMMFNDTNYAKFCELLLSVYDIKSVPYNSHQGFAFKSEKDYLAIVLKYGKVGKNDTN